jgi:hypothetical protein
MGIVFADILLCSFLHYFYKSFSITEEKYNLTANIKCPYPNLAAIRQVITVCDFLEQVPDPEWHI